MLFLTFEPRRTRMDIPTTSSRNWRRARYTPFCVSPVSVSPPWAFGKSGRRKGTGTGGRLNGCFLARQGALLWSIRKLWDTLLRLGFWWLLRFFLFSAFLGSETALRWAGGC